MKRGYRGGWKGPEYGRGGALSAGLMIDRMGKKEEIRRVTWSPVGERAGLIMMPQIKIEDLDASSESN